MTNAYNEDDELPFDDLIDDPVVTHTQPVAVRVASQLPHVGVFPPRIIPERSEGAQDRQRRWLRDSAELPDRALPPAERVFHAAPRPVFSSKIAATTSDML